MAGRGVYAVRPAVSVAIAADAVDLVAVQGGVLTPNGSIVLRGIGPDWSGAVPLSPERAAILAFQATGRRVSTVPTLYSGTPGDFPQGARWIFSLESDTELRGTTSGRVVTTARAVVRAGLDPVVPGKRRPGLYIPVEGARRVFSWMIPGPEGQIGVDLQFRPDVFMDYELATPVPRENP
jgi:hypothetical protein